MHILAGGLERSYELMHRKAIDTATKHIIFRPMLPDQVDVLFAGDATVAGNGHVQHNPESQRLSCFAGGMYILGGKIFDIKDHVEIGMRIARGCAWAYSAFPTGLMPEIFGLLSCPSKEPCQWDEKLWDEEGDQSLNIKGIQHARDRRYILRPEAIESIFYAYRVTGREELRDIAWEMFQSIVNATETPIAYSAISDVTAHGDTDKMNSMESFWTSETLKYFYLIFSSPDVVSRDDYVLNTEAHLLRRPN
ncbi:hypothetical protein N8I77_004375 [Diaporthe amygdali]|uniref:alpha-1,2-Mannosidase n=1 Tax=Phomopsis amygdali TaxID=1214568 RepID=A0AAD9SNB0_PHOAM|nr:hypothetical protein N8I77_004375 [Diaporthe amygdali]